MTADRRPVPRSARRAPVVSIFLVLLLAGCGGDDPAVPTPEVTGGDPPTDPPVTIWDPADFEHVYEVGPGRDYGDPGEVPWESMGPSTLVRIHWRAEPYRSKWVVNTVATADAPLVVLGVPDAGRRPVISGENAVTRRALSYWNEVRSVLKIGGSNLPADDVVPAHIHLQGLEIRSAQPAYDFTDDAGNPQTYAQNAAAIHVEVGAHVTIHDCELTDAGNGLFAGSGAGDLVVSANHIHGNGIAGSIYHHNSYTECRGITFTANRYGPLRAGALGNNLKDRSSGTVIRYNWIESGNRQLDLVETDHAEIRDDPAYDVTFVYGNILIEPDGAGNSQVVHYGGDGGDTAFYRRGTLHFFHNTLYSTRSGNTTLLRCATDDVDVDVRNNILVATAGGERLAITSGLGQISLRANWLPTGWRATHESVLTGTVVDLGNLTGTDPDFVAAAQQDFRPGAGSVCRDAATAAAATTAAHPADRQYLPHQSTATRVSGRDLGALDR